MRFIRRNSALVLFVVSLIVFTTIVTIAFFSRLYAGNQNWDLFLSSDALYLPSLYQDLIVEGQSLDDWHLNPAPNFFPDMAVYFILRFICGNFIWSTFLFALLQLLLMQGLFLILFRDLFPGRTIKYGLLIISGLVFFGCEALFFRRDISVAFHPFSNSYHVGAFVVSVVCFMISRNLILQPKLFHYVLLFLLCLLTTASDRLFLILFPAPFACTAFFIGIRQRPWQVLIFVLVAGIGSYVGMELFNHIDRNSYEILNQRMVGNSEEINKGWKEFCKNIFDIVTEGGFKSVIFCLTFLSLLVMPVLAFKSRKESPAVFLYSVYALFFTIIVLVAPILSGKYVGYDCLRYNIFPFFMGGLNLSVCLAYFFRRPVGFRWQYTSSFVLLASAAFLLTRVDTEGLNKYFYHYPPYVARLDALAAKEGIRQGVGNYWIAKKVTMFSKTGIKVRSVFDDLSIYDHVSNDRWFFDNIFTFVVLERFSDTTMYRRVIKEPRPLIYDSELKVIEADSFGYKRETGYRVISY